MGNIAPIFFILIITILTVEAWWLWFIYPNEQHLSMPLFIFLEFCILICLFLSFMSFTDRFSGKFIFISPFISPFLYLMLTKILLLKEKKYEEEKLKQEISKIIKLYGVSNDARGFEKIGDIYFSKLDFENALLWFNRARAIKETPEITSKINLVKREILLKQNKIWTCPECSATNSSNNKKCKHCGALRPSIGTLRDEIHRSITEIKKSLIIFSISVVMVSLFIWFISNASYLTSLIFFGIVFILFSFYILYNFFSK